MGDSRGGEARTLRAAVARRRRRSAVGFTFLAVVLVLCALVFALVVAPYLAGSTGFSPLVRRTGGAGAALGFLAFALIVELGTLLFYLPLLRHNRAFYTLLTRVSREYDPGDLALYMNALEGLAEKAGVKAPGISVLSIPMANALAFERRDVPVIGVTARLLSAGIPYSEAEAIVAVELADVIAGTHMRRPGLFGFLQAGYAGLGLFALLGFFGAPMVSAGRGRWWGAGFLAAVVAMVLLGGYLLRGLRTAGMKDHLLSDAAALELTGKPAALAAAIRRLDSMVNGKPEMPFPENEMALDSFFAPVYAFSDTPERFVDRRMGELEVKQRDRLRGMQVEGVEQVMRERREEGEALVAKRLRVEIGVRPYS